MRAHPAILALSSVLVGCNNYEMFAIAGYAQTEFNNDADILFVVDNSSSMEDEASALALNFTAFVDQLTSTEGSGLVTEDLSDAVGNFVTYTSNRGQIIDYQLGLTTTTVEYETIGTTGEGSAAVDPGEAGTLVGDPLILDNEDSAVAGKFRRNVLCDVTYWSAQSLASDPSFVCPPDPYDADPEGVISSQFLDCICGVNSDYENNTGGGQEEHLEAALMAMCRSVDDPPEECYDATSPFVDTEEKLNSGFLRPDSTAVVVWVTDEGDTSRRLTQGDEDISPYMDVFDQFDNRVRFVGIGPNYEDGQLSCNSGGATSWGVQRLQTAAEETQGFYADITAEDSGGACVVADFATHLRELGTLLNNLLTYFQLRTIPDQSTLRVWVDEREVFPGEENEDITGEYLDGWSYDPANNAVRFWGDDIPDYNQDVRIYYRPLEGNPRELPF